MARLPKNYKRGLDYLNANYPFFTVMVTNLGHPVINNTVLGQTQEGEPIYQVPTLQVQRRVDREKFELVCNEKFLAPLTDGEVAGVLAHEAFHIMFGHLSVDTTPKSEERAREVLGPEADEHKIHSMAKKMVTLACECVCNDNVLNEGFDLPDLRKPNPKTGELEGGLFFGPQVVGRSVAYYTTDEIIDLMGREGNKSKDMLDKMASENEHFVLISEEDLKDLQDQISKDIRHKVFEGKLDPKDINSNDLKNILKINGTSKKAGTGGSKTQRRFEKMGLSVNWFKYLRRLDPSAFRDGGSMGDLRTSWHAPRRKTAYMAPRINLPVHRPRFTPNNVGSLKPHIILALDFSGSIPPEMATIMGNLARMVPDTIDIHCCTFSDEYVPFNHKLDGEQETASGGTDFSAIQRFINSLHLAKDPNVVVITDGYARFDGAKPSDGALDNRWNWLLIDRSNSVQDSSVNAKTVDFLDEYLLQKNR